MSELWHVKGGLASYGPEPDEESGYPTAGDMTELCDLIVSELTDYVQMASDAADMHKTHAKNYRKINAEVGELDSLREYLAEMERGEELDNLRANCEPNRGKDAPAYKDRPEDWEAARRTFIESEFSGGSRNVTDNGRLYVWVCDTDGCEYCKTYRQENGQESPWNWEETFFKDQPNRQWWVRYLDWTDDDYHVKQLGMGQYSVGLHNGTVAVCSTRAEVEAKLMEHHENTTGWEPKDN